MVRDKSNPRNPGPCVREASEKNSTDCHNGRHYFVYLWGTSLFCFVGKEATKVLERGKDWAQRGGNLQRAMDILIWRIAAKIEELKGRAGCSLGGLVVVGGLKQKKWGSSCRSVEDGGSRVGMTAEATGS